MSKARKLMLMAYSYFIGVDVSKDTLDLTMLKEGEYILHQKLNNTTKAVGEYLKVLMKEHKAGGRKTIFCIEHTGSYMNTLLEVLCKRKANIWIESGLQIKRSLGLQRGKSDKADSHRIAEYAYTFQKKVRFWTPPRAIINELRLFRTIKLRLQSALNQLQAPLKEREETGLQKRGKEIFAHCKESRVALKKELLKTDKAILQLIKKDSELHRLFTLATSVFGIGPVIAVEMIIITNEFKAYSCAKKFACYAGIAPFEYTSGTSVKGRAKISPIGSKKMKALLHLAAMSSIRVKGELRDYYLNKVTKGYHKMSVLNAVRNKLIHRVFSCVRENRMYDPAGKPILLKDAPVLLSK